MHSIISEFIVNVIKFVKFMCTLLDLNWFSSQISKVTSLYFNTKLCYSSGRTRGDKLWHWGNSFQNELFLQLISMDYEYLSFQKLKLLVNGCPFRSFQDDVYSYQILLQKLIYNRQKTSMCFQCLLVHFLRFVGYQFWNRILNAPIN